MREGDTNPSHDCGDSFDGEKRQVPARALSILVSSADTSPAPLSPVEADNASNNLFIDNLLSALHTPGPTTALGNGLSDHLEPSKSLESADSMGVASQSSATLLSNTRQSDRNLRHRVKKEDLNEFDDIVIRLENPVETTTTDRRRLQSNAAPRDPNPLTQQEYKILRERKEAALDYHEACNNIYGLKYMGSKPSGRRCEQVVKWIITILIGFLVGAVGICLRLINTHISKEKWKVAYDYLAEGNNWAAWASFVGLSLCFAIPSAFIVIFVSPLVGSSGIPDVKTYLNGSNIPSVFSFNTLALKMTSTTLTVLGPIPSGLQGPMIHIGAILGGWFSLQFRRIVKRVFCCARQDQEIRDEEDMPYYPHPIPAVTFAPGYRAVVQAALAGVKVETAGPIGDDYSRLPKIGEHVPAPEPPSLEDPTSVAPAPSRSPSPSRSRAQRAPSSPRGLSYPSSCRCGPSCACPSPHSPAIPPFHLIRTSTLESIPLSALETSTHSQPPMSPMVASFAHLYPPHSVTNSAAPTPLHAPPALSDGAHVRTASSADLSATATVSAGSDIALVTGGAGAHADTDSDAVSGPQTITLDLDRLPSLGPVTAPLHLDQSTPSATSLADDATHYPLSTASHSASAAAHGEHASLGDGSSYGYEEKALSPVVEGEAAGETPTPSSIASSRAPLQRRPLSTYFNAGARGNALRTASYAGASASYASYGAPLSYHSYANSSTPDATVDGDIVPVSSTGRSALLREAGVVLPDSTRDVTADQHEFHKRARTHTREVQKLERQLSASALHHEVRTGPLLKLGDGKMPSHLGREVEMTGLTSARHGLGAPVTDSFAMTPREASGQEVPSLGKLPSSFGPHGGVKGLAPLPIYVDSQPKQHFCPRWLRNITIPSLSTDAHRRDFISIGCAAGMSASMGAPIGGVLYVLEEMGSYWSHSLALRILTGSVLASVTAAFIGTAASTTHRTGEFLPEHYATFFVGRRPAAYRVEELPAFIIVGILCGLFGGGFTFLAERIAKFRAAVYGKTKLRYALVTLVCLVIWASILFALPFGFHCLETTPEYATARAESVGAPADVYSVVRGNCAAGFHNPMATLTFARFDITAKRLLARGLPSSFEPSVLVVWFLVLFVGTVMLSNVASTPGVVLPFLIMGALTGRFVGTVLYDAFGHTDFETTPPSVYFDPGVYATVGAAAFFAGATRTTLSMSILVLEITSDLNLLLPILIGAFTAHLVSNLLSEPYYEVLIRLRKLPFLRSKPAHELMQITAAQLMIRDPVRLGSVETVAHILDVLESCTHNGFPVIMQPCAARHAQPDSPISRQHTYAASDATDAITGDGSRSLLDGREMPFGAAAHVGFGCDNTYIGMILRVHLLAIINRRVWRPESRPFTPEDYDRVLARASPKISELRLRLTPQDLQASVDLVPWVNSSAYVVPESMIGSRVFMLFRQLNLRHLPVVDINRGVVGMITRLELLEPVVKHKYDLLMQRQERNVERGGPDWREDWCQRRCALEKVRVAKEREREKLPRDTENLKEALRGGR